MEALVLALERRTQILSRIQSAGNVVVSELSREFGVTDETIRRDLDRLAQEGLARKTYGGAVRADSTQSDLPYLVRSRTNVQGKRLMGQLTADLIHDAASLALDASTSALYVVKALSQKRALTIITNSIEILTESSGKQDWNILSTGGALKGNGLALVGRQAERMLESFNVQWAIISCKGMDAEMGFMDSNEPDAEIKRAFIRQAARTIFLVDSTKLDRRSFVTIAPLSSAHTIVTDIKPDAEWLTRLAKIGVNVISP
ncbi:putative HTH-type transcriptional regulator YdjF [Clostridia bacterium]|nr:putative HTH-type transcriptional regulator YdjF [Clostridia bacterium]